MFNKLKDDIITAMKSKDPNIALLRTLQSDIQAKAKKANREVTDQDVVSTVKSFHSKIKESAQDIFKRGLEIPEDLNTEMLLYESYLPEQLTEAFLRGFIGSKVFIYKDEGKKIQNLIQKDLKAEFNGQYDGKQASLIIQELLAVPDMQV